MSKGTEETLPITDQMKNFEALMRLKSMKEGEKITWQHMAAVNFFFGDLIKSLPEPKVIGSAYFRNGTVLKTGILADATITEYSDNGEKSK
jgi:hypothetical protein